MKRIAISATAATLLLLGACGSRVDSDQAGGGLGGGGTPTTTAAPSESDGMFGTLEVPCRDGDTSSYPEQSDQGVTRDAIKIVTIADPGGPRPGLNQGIFDSMDAFAAWCNSLGGINGRKIELELRDAKILQYKEQVLAACDTAFALVGGLGILDDLGAQDAVDCGLPNVPGAVVTPLAADADLTWQTLPNPPDTMSIGPALWVAEQFPDAITTAASIRTRLPMTEAQADRLMEAYEEAGFEWVYSEASNINETNWDPLVLAMKNAGVEYFTLTSSYEEVLLMLQARGRQQWKPTVTELETNFYNQGFPVEAKRQGLDTEGVFVRLTTWPFEEAEERPAMRQYLEILEGHKSRYDTEPEQLGVQAFAAGLLWATAVDRLGADVTREGMAEELSKITEWDAGGLHGMSNPGEDVRSSCFVMMRVTPDGFVREYPLPDTDAEVFEAGGGMACPDDVEVSLPQWANMGARRK